MSEDTHMTPERAVVRADAMQRAERAWCLRISGSTWEEVAASTGFTDPSNCIRAVKAYFGTLPEVPREDARRMWRARHEALWSLTYRDAQDGRAGAVRAGVAVARSAAQLDGLDAPQRVEVTPDAATFEAVVQRMVAHVRGVQEVEEVDVVEYAEIDPTAED